jgi:hypothetical protein
MVKITKKKVKNVMKTKKAKHLIHTSIKRIEQNDIQIISVNGTLYKNIKYLSKLLLGFESSNLNSICDNIYFEKGYDCDNININETKELLQKTNNIPIDRTYIAIDKNINKIIGFMQFTIIPYILDDTGKQIIELAFAGTKSHGNTYYKGTGTLLLEYALNDYIKNDNINTFIIFGSTEQSIGLYHKMGFKQYGNTVILVKRVDNSILHPNILRQIEFNVFVKYKQKLHKNKQQNMFKFPYIYADESIDFWQYMYMNNPNNSSNNSISNYMFATEKMINEIKKFPKKYYSNDGIYHYGRHFI